MGRDVVGSFVADSEQRQIAILDNCCGDDSVRLFWKNRLGGVDQYTFNSERNVSQASSSELSQRSLNTVLDPEGSPAYFADSHNAYDYGRFKTNIQAVLEYKEVTNYIKPNISN